MQDRIFFKIPFYAASQAIQMGLPVLVTPFILRTLAPHEFGIYEAGCALMLLLNGILTLELSQALLRLHPESTFEKRQSLLASSVQYTLLIYALAYGIFQFFDLDLSVPKILISSFLICAGSNAILALFVIYARLELSVLRYVSLISVYGAAFISAHLFFYFRAKSGEIYPIEAIVRMQTDLSLVGILLCWMVLGRVSPFRGSKRVLAEMLRYSIPLGLASIPVYCLSAIELWAIGNSMGAAVVGSYSASARFAAVVNLAAAGAFAAIVPGIFQGKKAVGDSELLHRTLRQGFVAFEMYAIPLLVAVILFSREILGFVFPYAVDPFIPVFGVLCLGLFIGRLAVFFPGVEVNKKTSFIFFVQTGVLILGGLGYYLTSSSSILMNIALVSFGIHLLRLMILVFLSHRNIGASFEGRDWMPIGMLVVLAFVFLEFSDHKIFHSILMRMGVFMVFMGLNRWLVSVIARKLPRAFA